MNRKFVTIIPARGGSKGIPRKNLRHFAGTPLVARSIEAALSARQVDAVYVSSEDTEILEVSKKYGAETIERPKKHATDESSSESVLLDALSQLKTQHNYEATDLVFLQCTSPFTEAHEIDGMIKKHIEVNADSSFSCIPSHSFLWKKNSSDESMIALNHEATKRLRRQDIEPEYQETGSIYIMKIPGFIENKSRFFGKVTGYEVSDRHRIDIDSEQDWKLAELIATSSAS